MTNSRRGANEQNLKDALGPLGWATPLLDNFFNAREFDDFLVLVNFFSLHYYV